ncbi:TPA: HNH endonuclease [bacterium]|nr:HNH endonuclease [bacterium]
MVDLPVLTLNSGMIPIDICRVRDAIVLQLLNKAAAIKVEQGKWIRSQYLSFALPRVITLFNYHKIPEKKVVYSRLNIIYRDDMRCMFCGKRFSMDQLTVDHLIPQSRWDALPPNKRPLSINSWENQVCACKGCNSIKGDRLLHECGLKLIRKPYEPKYLPHLVISKRKAEEYGWLEFLGYNVKVVDLIE